MGIGGSIKTACSQRPGHVQGFSGVPKQIGSPTIGVPRKNDIPSSGDGFATVRQEHVLTVRALDQMADFVKKLWILNREIVFHEADHVVVRRLLQQAH